MCLISTTKIGTRARNSPGFVDLERCSCIARERSRGAREKHAGSKRPNENIFSVCLRVFVGLDCLPCIVIWKAGWSESNKKINCIITLL